jgi:hypothetical protein
MDLPGGGNHWARNLLLSADGGKLYVTVGSSSNIAENGIDQEKGRAIHEYDFAKHRSREFAGGLRNPNGLDWNPHSGELWTVVNERDMLGPIVPDYLTNVPLGAPRLALGLLEEEHRLAREGADARIHARIHAQAGIRAGFARRAAWPCLCARRQRANASRRARSSRATVRGTAARCRL